MKKFILAALAFVALNATAGSSIAIKPIVSQPKCFGASTGQISLSLMGGTAPYQYSWSNGAISASLSGIAAGTYSVTVTDANNLSGVTTVVVTQSAKINLSTSTVNVSQQGASDGCIHLNVDGGVPDYSYEWSNGSTEQNPCGLAAGTYTVTVTDAFGCTASTSKQLSQPVQRPASKSFSHNNLAISFEPTAENTANNHRSDITGIENQNESANTEIAVYPNPANGFVSIKTGADKSEVTLVNMTGQTVLHRVINANEANIEISDLAKGNYIVSVKTENGTSSQMLTVTK
jgi:hypothetical protein